MTFGEKLRQSRIIKKMTQKQLADLIGAKHNSVSDWENDKNKPDPDTIELLCGVLEISPNYLLNSSTSDFSPLEIEIIKKYRNLDEFGKKNVDTILENEYKRCGSELEGQLSLYDLLESEGIDIDSLSHAARKATDEFQKEIKQFTERMLQSSKARKEVDDFSTEFSKEFFGVKAAHNEHDSDPQEKEKMNADISILKRPENSSE